MQLTFTWLALLLLSIFLFTSLCNWGGKSNRVKEGTAETSWAVLVCDYCPDWLWCGCVSPVGRSGADVGAQTDPSSRRGARAGERLTDGGAQRETNERCRRRRRRRRRGPLTGPALEDSDGPRKTRISFKLKCWILTIPRIAWLWSIWRRRRPAGPEQVWAPRSSPLLLFFFVFCFFFSASPVLRRVKQASVFGSGL